MWNRNVLQVNGLKAFVILLRWKCLMFLTVLIGMWNAFASCWYAACFPIPTCSSWQIRKINICRLCCLSKTCTHVSTRTRASSCVNSIPSSLSESLLCSKTSVSHTHLLYEVLCACSLFYIAVLHKMKLPLFRHLRMRASLRCVLKPLESHPL